MTTPQNDLAEAMIRMFGRDALRQVRENAASNAKAGDTASEKMWLKVADILEHKNRHVAPLK